MATDEILTPGSGPVCSKKKEETSDSPTCLKKENFLSEFSSESEKSIARENLGVPTKDNVYTKLEVDNKVASSVNEAIRNHVETEDPHGTLTTVREEYKNVVRDDGTTPFKEPQTQNKEPYKDNHLTTKKFVEDLLRKHTSKTGQEDPHRILPEVAKMLTEYVKQTDIYRKKDLYTKEDVDCMLSHYVTADGNRPFRAPQLGVDPTVDSHLATKRYVDSTMYKHLVDVDPHGFFTILNNRLKHYVLSSDVYRKNETYSRIQIDEIINRSIQELLSDYIDKAVEPINDRITKLEAKNVVLDDGTVSMKAPLAGMPAEESNQYVTLEQCEDKSDELSEQLKKYVEDKNAEWVTSGPVEATAGLLEKGMEVPPVMSVQEAFDAIFYGKAISLFVPKVVPISETGDITVCVRGAAMIDTAVIKENDVITHTFVADDFKDGCVTVPSQPIFEDDHVSFEVTFKNGAKHEVSDVIKCGLPAFFGLLPKWKTASTVSMEYLKELVQNEPLNNVFTSVEGDPIVRHFKFEDPRLRHIYCVIPKSDKQLTSIVTKSQSFDLSAFDIVNEIPLKVPAKDGGTQDVIYVMYVYKQALSNLDIDVTFNF